MRKSIGRIGHVGMAIFVATALAFGTSEALATTSDVQCNGGTCPSGEDTECQANCDAIFGQGTREGRCDDTPPDGCCLCLI